MVYMMALLGFAFVIAIHELGHFVFAKWAGVRVDRFSIGMGPVIWSRTWGETEYALSLLPVGGYVKMLGQEDVPGRAVDALDPRSYLAKSAPWRALILLGGVLFNFISSWLILIVLAFTGAPVFPPVVGSVAHYTTDHHGEKVETTAWRLGLHRGDRILEVNGQPVRDFTDAVLSALAAGDEPVTMRVRRGTEELSLPPAGEGPVYPVYNPQLGRPDLGLEMPQGLRIAAIGSLKAPQEGAPQVGDRVLGVVESGATFTGEGATGQDLNQALLPYVGQAITLRVLGADGHEREAALKYAGPSGLPIDAALGLPIRIERVLPGSPAQAGGLQAGDVLLSADDRPVRSTAQLSSDVQIAAAEGRSVVLRYLRLMEGHYQERSVALVAQADPREGRLVIGVVQSPVAAGVLPVIPAQGPLASAGLRAGDALVRIDLGQISSSEPVSALVLPQASQRLIATDDRTWYALAQAPSMSLVRRLLGGVLRWDPTPALLDRIGGARVIASGGGELRLQRDGADVTLDLAALPVGVATLLSQLEPGEYIAAGVGLSASGGPALIALSSALPPKAITIEPQDPGMSLVFLPEQVPYQLTHWTEAFDYANDAATHMIVSSLKLIPRFFQSAEQGGIDASKSLQGPIGIFNELSARLEHLGLSSFLHLLALIGLNLVLVNLLPIPIVDGGQLLFLAIETIIRRPVPLRIQEAANWAGFALVVFMMLFVIGNDIARLL